MLIKTGQGALEGIRQKMKNCRRVAQSQSPFIQERTILEAPENFHVL
jgi:hypothetical protein